MTQNIKNLKLPSINYLAAGYLLSLEHHRSFPF